jgi:glycosyltransferase involved in cell wall biosynthesis
MADIILAVTTDLTHDQRMLRTARALNDAGYKILLVGRQLPDSVTLTDEKFNQHRLRPPFKSGKAFYLFYNLQLFVFLLAQNAKTLVAVDFDSLLGTWLASKFKRTPCILDAHEFFTDVPELQGRTMSRYAWHCLGRFIIPRLSAAYTVNQSLARLLGTCYKRSFHVVRNLPEKQILTRSKESSPPFLLYQGALNQGRGLETLIDVAPRLPVPVYLAGDGDLKEELQERAHQKGLADHVFFLGKLAPAELHAVTKQAFLGYNLLESSSRSYYYSLANKFFDYMQAGIPSLSNPFPEYTRITAQYHVAELIPLDQDQLVSSVWELWNNPAIYQSMQEDCLKARHVFSWENEIPNLLKIYKHVVSSEKNTA